MCRLNVCTAIAVLGLVALALAGSAGAATIVVDCDGGGDFLTLQEGIDAATEGDTVLVAPCTYTGGGNVNLDFGGVNLTLLAVAGPESTVIDCADTARGFYFHSGEDTTSVVAGFTILNGYSADWGGGIRCDASSPKFVDLVLTEGSAYRGGGLSCLDGSSSVLDRVTFSSNSSSHAGGGLHTGASSSLKLRHCEFVGNTSGTWGGGAILGSGTYVLFDCTFERNSADWGGGLSCRHEMDGLVSGCTFRFNKAAEGGGGASFEETAHPTITNCVVYADTANHGGGIYFGDYASPLLENLAVFANVATGYGGGLYCNDRVIPTLHRVTIADNSTANTGGGIHVDHNAGAVITNTCFAFNEAEGIFCEVGGSPLITHCCSYGNTVTDSLCGTYHDNIFVDPEFCDRPSGNYTVRSGSPCLPYGNPWGETIGAYGPGCFSAAPVITSVADVGNDQGGQVRVRWLRSLYDAPGDTVTITGYGIYRRQDQYKASAIGVGGANCSAELSSLPRGSRLDGWDYLFEVPARGDSAYQAVVPTLCDSTEQDGICWSVFMVSAITPDPLVYFDSRPDSGYSVDNLEPEAPEPVRGEFDPGTGAIALSWPRSKAPDFAYFEVHRGDGPDFLPDVGNRVAALTDTTYVDTTLDWTASTYYKVAAVDFGGNRSEYGSLAIVETGVPQNDAATALRVQNVPNPFRPSAGGTEIQYVVRAPGGRVRVSIFDLSGHLVKRLVDQDVADGVHTVSWDGTDELGRPVASGVYFYRVVAPGAAEQRKMVLLR